MFGVSRETLDALKHLAEELRRWNRTINLVSPSTISDLWRRHIADSAQLWPHRPRGDLWIDLGSGAGFPALVIAVLAREAQPKLAVHLVESDRRKAAFLLKVSADLRLSTHVHISRIELVKLPPGDVVSARALAPLSELMRHAHRLRAPDGVALFPKGRSAEKELDAARAEWDFECRIHPSLTDPAAAILEIGAIHGPR